LHAIIACFVGVDRSLARNSKKMNLHLMIAPSLTLAGKSVIHHAPVLMVLIVLSRHCLSLPNAT
jgi:hypothetical protein